MKNLSFGDKLKAHLTQKESELTGRRFCRNCQTSRKDEGGSRLRGRWLCAVCTASRNEYLKSR